MGFDGTTLKFDISELRDGINQANTLIKTNETQWRKYASSMDDWSNTAGGLTERNKNLNSQLEEQKKKVENQSKIVDEYKEKFGEQSEQTQRQIQILNQYQIAVNKTSNEIEKNKSKIESLSTAEAKAGKTTAELKKETEANITTRKNYQKSIEETEKKIDDLSKSTGNHSEEITQLRKKLAEERKALEEAGGAVEDLSDKTQDAERKTGKFSKALDGIKNGAKVAVAGLTAMVGAIGGAVAGMAGIAESTRELRTSIGKVETAFTISGLSAKEAEKTYKNFYGVLGDEGKATEAVSHLAKLANNQKDLTKWTDIATGVYATFGDSLPIEGLTEASNETAKTGQLTGVLADALNWAGVNEDDFQSSLDKCTTEQERQALITDTLNGLYSEASEKYKEVNKEVIEANKAQAEFSSVLAEIGAIAEPFTTKIKSMGASFLSNLIPGLNGTVQAVKDMINGIAGADKNLVYNLGYLIGSATSTIKGWWETAKPVLSTMFTEVFPTILGKALAEIPGFIASIAKSIYENAPKIVSSLADGIVGGLEGLKESIDSPILTTMLDGVINAFKWVSDNSKLVVNGLLLIGGAIATFSIIKTVTGWINSAKTAFTLLNAVMKANPIGLVVTAIGLLVSAFTLLYQNNESFREFVNGLWEKVKEFGTNLWKWVTVDVPKFISEFVSKIKEIPLRLKEKLDEAIEKAITFITDMKAKAKEAGKALIDGFIEKASNFGNEVKGKLDDGISKAKTFVTDMKSKAKEAGKALIDGFLEKTKNIATDIMSVGKNLIQGVWNGINNAKEWLSEKIGSIFGADGFIIGGIKKLLGIHSPSTVGASLGDYFMQGFEDGLKQRAKTTEEVAEEAMTGVVESANNSLISDNAGSFTVATATPTASESNTNPFASYRSELQKTREEMAKVEEDMKAIWEARDMAFRKGESTAEFDEYLKTANAKLDELKAKEYEILNPSVVTLGDTFLNSFNGLDTKLQDFLGSALEGAISGDTSKITSGLENVSNFLVSGLQSFLSSAIPGVGGFVASAVGGIFNGIKSLIKAHNDKKKQKAETDKAISYAEMLAKAQAEAYNETLRKTKRSIAEEFGANSNSSVKALVDPQEKAIQKVVNYTQNNYSPKALSAKEIYRNNNRAINMLQQGVRV